LITPLGIDGIDQNWKDSNTLDPRGAGSQNLRISLPKRFFPFTGAHVAL